jgi:hypothetical protein
MANDGQDTRAIQQYLWHRNIQNTIRYTELAPDRFKDFWRDCPERISGSGVAALVQLAQYVVFLRTKS